MGLKMTTTEKSDSTEKTDTLFYLTKQSAAGAGAQSRFPLTAFAYTHGQKFWQSE